MSQGHVLVTGSSGAVGRHVVTELLRRGRRVRGFDRSPPKEEPGNGFEFVAGDVAEAGAVHEATGGCDVVAHLAAYPNDADFFDTLVEPNVVGLMRVLTAAQEHGVAKVIVTSSIQSPRDGRPAHSRYALTKLWAEQAAHFYHGQTKAAALAVRLGWMPRDAEDSAHIARRDAGRLYLSPADSGRFYADAVEATFEGYHLLYAFSRGGAADALTPAKELIGYEPQDEWPAGAPR